MIAISSLIILTVVVIVWQFVWPRVKDTKIELHEGEFWKKDVPSLFGKGLVICFISTISLLMIEWLWNIANSQPSGSLFNAVFISVMLFACFFGLNKLIKFESSKAGAGQQILLWGIYGIIIFTIAHDTLNSIITDKIYFVGITYGIPALTILWLISFWPNLQNAFAIPVGGALLCFVFALRSYINTGNFPLANGENWMGYWPVIFLAIATFILSVVFYKQKKWDERLSKTIISSISIIIILLMTPLIILMAMGKISPDKISRIAEYNRTANFSIKSDSSTLRRNALVDYTIHDAEELLKKFNRGDPSVTMEEMNKVTANRRLAVENFFNGAEEIVKNAPKEKSIEALILSESFSLYRENKNKISMFIVRLQL